MTEDTADATGSNPSPLDAALASARRGFHVFPIEPGTKRPLVKWGQQATTDEATIRRWFGRWPDADHGIACGPSGLLVVDVDVKGGHDGPGSLSMLEMLQDNLPPTAEARTPSGGRHLYFRGACQTSAGRLGDGLDVRSTGGMVVAYPTDGAPIADAPGWLVEAATALPPSRAGKADAGDLTPEIMEANLEQLEVEDFREHDRWLNLMMSCHHATDGLGREEFVDWSTGDANYAGDGARIRARWDSLHGDRPGAITKLLLFKEVLAAGGAVVDHGRAEDDFEPVDPRDFEPWLGNAGTLPSSPLDEMNNRHVCVLDGGKFRIYSVDTDPEFEDRPYFVVQTQTDFANFHANRKIEVPDGKKSKTMGLGTWWLNQPGRCQAQSVIFMPDRPSWVSDGRLNLWQGWSVEPRKGDWSLMRRLILEGICAGDEGLDRYVMDWLAFLVQHPEKPAEVNLVMRGGKGTGKGTVGRAVVKLAGKHGLHLAQAHHLTGKFNGHLAGCVCLFADEVFASNDKQAAAVLNQLTTEGEFQAEQKGKDSVARRNRLHIIIASNEEWVAPMSPDERRFAVLDVSSKFKDDRAFFDALNRQMEDGGLAAMLEELQTRQIGNWSPRDDVPQTRALVDQQVLSLNTLESWWHGRIREGTMAGMAGDWSDWETVSKEEVRNDYAQWHRARDRSRPPLEEGPFTKALKELLRPSSGASELRTKRKPKSSIHQTYLFQFPPLVRCKELFPLKVDWSDNSDDSES